MALIVFIVTVPMIIPGVVLLIGYMCIVFKNKNLSGNRRFWYFSGAYNLFCSIAIIMVLAGVELDQGALENYHFYILLTWTTLASVVPFTVLKKYYVAKEGPRKPFASRD
jgi:hypothetical protein